MITKNDLYDQFHSETGKYVGNSKADYYDWLEGSYIEKLNEEKELNVSLEELFLSNITDGE